MAEPTTPIVPERTDDPRTPHTPAPEGSPIKTAHSAMAKLVAEDKFVKFVQKLHGELPSVRDDTAWVGRFKNINLDTDDAAQLANFHLWRKRMEIVLNNYQWLLYPPDDIALAGDDDQAIFFHFDQLFFSVLTENVCGSQLEDVVLACTSGCAAYAALCARNESAHVRASIGLFVDLVQLIDWEKEPRLDPRSTVAQMTRISHHILNDRNIVR